MMREEKLVLVIVGAIMFGVASIVGGMLYVSRQPVILTQATPQCTIIEQAGFRSVKCLPSVNLTESVMDERE